MLKGTKNKNNYILFNAPTKSYLRIFLAVESGNSITANLFQNPNMTSSAPIFSTIANGGTDRSNVSYLTSLFFFDFVFDFGRYGSSLDKATPMC